MHLSPEDQTRQFGKTFDAQTFKNKANKYGEKRVQDFEQNKEIQIIKKQLFDRIFDEKQSLKRNNGGNKSLTIGIHNSGVNDPEEYSKRTGQKYQSTLCSRKTTNEFEMKLKKLESQNDNLLEVVKKRQQQIYHLKETIKEKQNTIYDKEKIIRRFLMEKTEHVVEGKTQNKTQQQLLSANLAIQSLKNQIFNHIQNQYNLKQKIDSLEKKNQIPFPVAGKQKQYEQRIKQQKLQLQQFQQKTRQLKKQHAKLEAMKNQNRHLRQVIKSYQNDNQQPSTNIAIQAIGQKVQNDIEMIQQLGDVDNYRTIQMQKMINDLIQKLQNRNAKLKQKQQECNNLVQTQKSFTTTVDQKNRQIQQIRNILQDVNLTLQNSQKTIEQYKKQIQILNQKLHSTNDNRQQDMNRLYSQMKHLSQQNKTLAKKNIEMNQSIINNLNELQSIEKINEQISQRLQTQKLSIKNMMNQIQQKNEQIISLQNRLNNQENQVENDKRNEQVIINEFKTTIKELQTKIEEILDEKQKTIKSIVKQFEEKLQNLENNKKQEEIGNKQNQEKWRSMIQYNQKELNTLKNQNEGLKNSIDKVKDQNQAIVLELNKMKQNNKQLENQILESTKTSEQFKKITEDKQKQIKELHSAELQTLQQDLELRFKEQLSTLTLSSDQQSNKLNSLFSQNNNLKDQLSQTKQQLSQKEQQLSQKQQQLSKTKQQLQNQLSTQTITIQQLTNSSSNQQTLIQSIQSKLQQLQTQNQSLQTQLASQLQLCNTLTSKNNINSQTISTLQNKNTQIIDQLNQLKGIKIQIQSQLDTQKQLLQQTKNTSNQKHQQLIQNYEQKILQIQTSKQTQQSQFKKQIQNITSNTNNQIQKLTNDNTNLSSNINSLNQQLTQINTKLNQLTNRNTQIQQQLITKTKQLQQLQQHQQQLINQHSIKLQTVQDQKQSIQNRLKQQISSLSLSSNQYTNKMNTLFEENNQLQKKIETLQKQYQIVVDEANKNKERIVGLESEIQIKNLEYGQLKQVHEGKEEQLAHYHEMKIQEIESEKNDLINKSNEEIHLLKQSIQTLTESNNTFSSKINQLEKQLRSSSESLENFIEQTVNKESHIHLLEKDIKGLKQEASDNVNEIKQKYQNQLNELRVQNKTISENYQAFVLELESIQQDNDKMNKQLEELKQVNQELRQENNEYQLKLAGSNISDKSDKQLTSLSIEDLIKQVEKLKAQQKEYNEFIVQKENQIGKKQEEYNALMGEYDLLREQISQITRQFEGQQNDVRDSLEVKDNDMEDKIQAIVNSLAQVYNHEQSTPKLKSFLLKCLNDCGITPKQKQQRTSQQKRITMNEILKDNDKLGKTEISETVTGVINNNPRLSGYVIHFLQDLVQSNENLVIETDKIQMFCTNLKQFEDEVEKKLAKLEHAVSLYLKAASEVFHYNAQEIQDVSDQSRSVRFSEADESFSEKPVMPHNIGFQNLLKSQQQITPIKATLQQSLQGQQSLKLFQDIKKQIAFSKQQKHSQNPKLTFSKDLTHSQKQQQQPQLNKSLQNSGARSKPSVIKATFVDDQQSDQSQLQSLDDSHKPQTYKDQYKSTMKNRMMQMSRNPYNKSHKKREQ